MDTKEAVPTTAPSVAPAKPASKTKPACEPHPQDRVPSVPLSGPKDDSLDLTVLVAALMNCVLNHLKAKRGKRRQGEEEPKTTTKASMKHLMMQPLARSPARAHQGRWNTLQHPLLQPLYLWPRVQALLVCLTKPMEWTASLRHHLGHDQ